MNEVQKICEFMKELEKLSIEHKIWINQGFVTGQHKHDPDLCYCYDPKTNLIEVDVTVVDQLKENLN